MDDTRFVREIKEQPAALRSLAGYYGGREGEAVLAEAAGRILRKKRVILTGMGTSLHVSYLLLHECAGIRPYVTVREAGELLHFGLPGVCGDDIVVAVSQSGESAETKRVVEELCGRVEIISIVNSMESCMGKNSDCVLPIHAGVEATISTKTYTNTLGMLYLLSSSLRGENPDMVIRELEDVAGTMEENLHAAGEDAVRAAGFFGPLENLHVIARGSDLVTANQLSLIIKEGACVFSEALSAGLFRHGPIELAGEKHAAVFIVSSANEQELTSRLAFETKNSGSRVLLLSDGERSFEDSATVSVRPPSPRYFPLACAPFVELFVHEAAKSKGREAGVFRRATKITGIE